MNIAELFSDSTKQVRRNTRTRIFSENRAPSIHHTVVFALLGMALWGSDWALDVAFAKRALPFRVSVMLVLLLSAFIKRMSDSIHVGYLTAYISLALGEAILTILFIQQPNGLILGTGQYLYFFLGSLLLCGLYPFIANLLGCVALAAMPHLVGFLLMPSFPHPFCALVVWPACVLTLMLQFKQRVLLVELAKSQQELESSLLIDPATGLLNFRGLTHAFQRLIRLGEARPLQQFLLLIDIDGLDKIQEAHGEPFAQSLFKKVAEILDISCRGRDITATPYPNEIVCILQQVSREKAFDIAERFRQAVAGEKFACPTAEAGLFNCTISVGIVSADLKQDIKSLLNHARIARNQAQHLGGNQTVCL